MLFNRKRHLSRHAAKWFRFFFCLYFNPSVDAWQISINSKRTDNESELLRWKWHRWMIHHSLFFLIFLFFFYCFNLPTWVNINYSFSWEEFRRGFNFIYEMKRKTSGTDFVHLFWLGSVLGGGWAVSMLFKSICNLVAKGFHLSCVNECLPRPQVQGP